MSKRVNLISNENQKIDNFENINLSELDSVFNYSCEILICKYFSLLACVNIYHIGSVKVVVVGLVLAVLVVVVFVVVVVAVVSRWWWWWWWW